MTTHPNRVSSDLPKEVVLTELPDPVNACHCHMLTNGTYALGVTCVIMIDNRWGKLKEENMKCYVDRCLTVVTMATWSMPPRDCV